jgi:type III pantothenate kinase
VGNSRIKFCIARGEELDDSRAVPTADVRACADQIASMLSSEPGAEVVAASVNAPVADELEESLLPIVGHVHRVGRDLQVPIGIALDDASTVGQDRLLNALGAFRRARLACVVIDVGTAVTVDFVDGVGTFQGGVIAPGPRLMLESLHERTSALPEVAYTVPDPGRGAFGKDTAHAMLLGARCGVQGLVHLVVDRYAEAFGAYPRVIATGGDALSLFENDDIVEHVVPDLQLMGLAAACAIVLGDDAPGDEPGAG